MPFELALHSVRCYRISLKLVSYWSGPLHSVSLALYCKLYLQLVSILFEWLRLFLLVVSTLLKQLEASTEWLRTFFWVRCVLQDLVFTEIDSV